MHKLSLSGPMNIHIFSDCGNLTDPVNGTVHYMSGESRTGYGALANYTCLAGSTLLGYVQRLCQSSGRWSGSSPRCIICRYK